MTDTQTLSYKTIVFKEMSSEKQHYKLPIVANVTVTFIKNQETNEVKSKQVTFTVDAQNKNSKIIIPAATFYQIPEIKKSNHIRLIDCDTKKGHRLYSQDSQSYIMAFGIDGNKLNNEILFAENNINMAACFSNILHDIKQTKKPTQSSWFEAIFAKNFNLFEKLPKSAYLEMSKTKSDDLTILADNSIDKLYHISINYKK